MKTYKNLYPQIYDFDNLYWAFRAARRGKRKKEPAAAFEVDLEPNPVPCGRPQPVRRLEQDPSF